MRRTREAEMRCVLDHCEQCLFEKCRYFIQHFCILTKIDPEGWPEKGCRFKNKYVRQVDGKDEELLPMGEKGPGNIQ